MPLLCDTAGVAGHTECLGEAAKRLQRLANVKALCPHPRADDHPVQSAALQQAQACIISEAQMCLVLEHLVPAQGWLNVICQPAMLLQIFRLSSGSLLPMLRLQSQLCLQGAAAKLVLGLPAPGNDDPVGTRTGANMEAAEAAATLNNANTSSTCALACARCAPVVVRPATTAGFVYAMG